MSVTRIEGCVRCPVCDCQMFEIFDVSIDRERWKCNTCEKPKTLGSNQFAPTSVYASEEYIPLPPAKPTQATPGTAARVQEYSLRVDRGEAVFHPQDRVDFMDTDQVPLNRSMTKRGSKKTEKTHGIRVIDTQSLGY